MNTPTMNSYSFYFRSVVSASITRLVVLFFLFSLVACVNQATPTAPGAIIENSSPSVTKQSTGNRATAQLIADAQEQFQRNDWQAAIAIAERGLRVDRREVRLYLLIAKSYRALGSLDISKQFAEQGLRYVSEPTSAIALEFNRLLTVSS